MSNYSVPNLLRSALATGDLIYRAASSTWSRLAIGSTDNLLTVISGVPAWRSLADRLLTLLTTRGDILQVAAGPVVQRLAKGAANTIVSADANDTLFRTLLALLDAITGATSAQGDLWYRGASDVARLARPSAGSLLWHDGTASNPQWKQYRCRIATDSPTTTDTNMQTDSSLDVALSAGKTYVLHYRIVININSASDHKHDFSYSGSMTTWSEIGYFTWGGASSGNGGFSRITTLGNDTTILFVASVDTYIDIWVYAVTSTAGTLSWRFAENTNSTANTRRAGSFVECWEAM